jgi:hypothetical protein
MPAVGFEPTIPASERPQTHALDRAAAGIGTKTTIHTQKSYDWLMAEWPKRLQILLQLDGPSFHELLEMFTPTIAKRNSKMRETVTLSVHPLR